MNLICKESISSIKYFTNEIDVLKESILFIHPAFATHEAFNLQFEYFTNDYNIIALDLIGHGLTQGIKTKDKICDTSRHIEEILEVENIDKVHLVGVSIGGLLAQDFANKNCENVLSLTAVGSYDINNYDSSMEKGQIKQQFSFMLKAIFSIKSFSKSNSKISAYTEEAQEDFYQMNLMFKRKSFTYMSGLKKIMNCNKEVPNYPLLIIVGEHDSELAKTLSQRWDLTRMNCSYEIIDCAGHCVNMDNPHEFNELLENFINHSQE